MVMCNRQEWLVDLVRDPGMLLPLRPDTVPQAPYHTLLMGHPSGLQPQPLTPTHPHLASIFPFTLPHPQTPAKYYHALEVCLLT